MRWLAVVVMLCVGGTALAQTDVEARNKALIQEALDAWAAGTGSPYDLLADDATWTIVGNSAASKTYPSKEAFLAEVIRPFVARMSVGLKPTIHGLYADGDTVVAYFDASGTAKDGVGYANTYAWILTFADGRIVRAVAFYDAIAFNELWERVQP